MRIAPHQAFEKLGRADLTAVKVMLLRCVAGFLPIVSCSPAAIFAPEPSKSPVALVAHSENFSKSLTSQVRSLPRGLEKTEVHDGRHWLD